MVFIEKKISEKEKKKRGASEQRSCDRCKGDGRGGE